MQSFKASFGPMYYHVKGNGPTLLLLSGLGRDSRSWESHLDGLQESYTCITLDNRGSGKSVYEKEPYRIEDMASDCLDLLDHLGVKSCFVMGISLGSAIAQALAIAAPARVEKMVLLAPVFQSLKYSTAACSQSLTLLHAGVKPAQALQTVIFLFNSSYKRFNRTVEQKLSDSSQAVQCTLNDLELQTRALSQFDLDSFQITLSTPTLAITGDQDRVCPLKTVVKLHGYYDNLQFKIVNCAHSILNEELGTALDEIQKFLK